MKKEAKQEEGRREEKSRKTIEDKETGERKGEQSADCGLVKENEEKKGGKERGEEGGG